MEVVIGDTHKAVEEVKRGTESTKMICGICKRVIDEEVFFKETLTQMETRFGITALPERDPTNPFEGITDGAMPEIWYYHTKCGAHYLITQRGLIEASAMSLSMMLEAGIIT